MLSPTLFLGLMLFSVLISIVISSRGNVCLSCMRYFLSFSLPLCVGGWLQIVIVAFLGLFI